MVVGLTTTCEISA